MSSDIEICFPDGKAKCPESYCEVETGKCITKTKSGVPRKTKLNSELGDNFGFDEKHGLVGDVEHVKKVAKKLELKEKKTKLPTQPKKKEKKEKKNKKTSDKGQKTKKKEIKKNEEKLVDGKAESKKKEKIKKKVIVKEPKNEAKISSKLPKKKSAKLKEDISSITEVELKKKTVVQLKEIIKKYNIPNSIFLKSGQGNGILKGDMVLGILKYNETQKNNPVEAEEIKEIIIGNAEEKSINEEIIKEISPKISEQVILKDEPTDEDDLESIKFQPIQEEVFTMPIISPETPKVFNVDTYKCKKNEVLSLLTKNCLPNIPKFMKDKPILRLSNISIVGNYDDLKLLKQKWNKGTIESTLTTYEKKYKGSDYPKFLPEPKIDVSKRIKKIFEDDESIQKELKAISSKIDKIKTKEKPTNLNPPTVFIPRKKKYNFDISISDDEYKIPGDCLGVL